MKTPIRTPASTLIELLVGLALTSMILVLLFTGVGLGFKGMSRLDDQSGASRRDATWRSRCGARSPPPIGD